ncbi:MAG: anthranilate phosphoribosyltransferase, partial [Limnobacter sp.]|nr:anthranilate phosphoribosyltransferase [Limnobacter sp.]
LMRSLVTPVAVKNTDAVVDLCGTGGDGAKTFNISTACMFVLAACGATVGKHGGRSVSSSSGSADALEALGANINLSPEQVASCMQQTGVGFMFAPNHHSAMRFAGPVRKELGVRTVFNALGPLTNPAGAKRQLMGVYDKSLLALQANVLKQLGSTHAMIVHGHNGMDELCLECPTDVAELHEGEVRQYTFHPDSVGLQPASHDSFVVSSVQESLDKMQTALQGQGGAIADVVALNSGAALYVAGKAKDIAEGVQLARQAMQSGQASQKLKDFIAATRQFSR